jgi:hypothetical protein
MKEDLGMIEYFLVNTFLWMQRYPFIYGLYIKKPSMNLKLIDVRAKCNVVSSKDNVKC